MMISKIPINQNDLLSQAFPYNDYADCYKIQFNYAKRLTVDQCIPAVFNTPGWVNVLLKIRNVLVKPFGLKVSDDDSHDVIRLYYDKGDAAGIFEVLNRNEHEIVLAIFDRHLDAGISIMLDYNQEVFGLHITTVVVFNNTLGKVYFFIIRPFHKLIVRSLLKRSIKSIN